MSANQQLPIEDVDRVIEMAWEDRTPFEAIEMQFGLKEKDVIALMRSELKASSFRMWRRRVSGRRTKHQATSQADRFRASCHR
ncbi:MAG: TIGR03643 family protein [Cyanobacteriota bacterium]|nr:TIGR03643 family protein [Cyanobacteriota bacterium]